MSLSKLLLEDYKVQESENSIYFKNSYKDILDYKSEDKKATFNSNTSTVGISKSIDSIKYVVEISRFKRSFDYDYKEMNFYLKDGNGLDNYAIHNAISSRLFAIQTNLSKQFFDINIDCRYNLLSNLAFNISLVNSTLFNGELVCDSLYHLPINLSNNSIYLNSRYTFDKSYLEVGFNIKRYNLVYENIQGIKNANYRDTIYSKYDINSYFSYNIAYNQKTSIGDLLVRFENEKYIANGELKNDNIDIFNVDNSTSYYLKSSINYKNSFLSVGFEYNDFRIDSLMGIFNPKTIFPETIFVGTFFKYYSQDVQMRSYTTTLQLYKDCKFFGFDITSMYSKYSIVANGFYREKIYLAYPLPYFKYGSKSEIELISIQQDLITFMPTLQFHFNRFDIKLSVTQIIPVDYITTLFEESPIEGNDDPKSGEGDNENSDNEASFETIMDGGRVISTSISYHFGK